MITIIFFPILVDVTAEVLKIENERHDHLNIYHTCNDEYKKELSSLNNQRQLLVEQLHSMDNQVLKLNQSIIELETKHDSIMSTFNTRLQQLHSNNSSSSSSSNVLNSNIYIQNILHTIHTFEHQFADVLMSQVITLSNDSSNRSSNSCSSNDVVMKISAQDPKVTRNNIVYLIMCVLFIIILILIIILIIIITTTVVIIILILKLLQRCVIVMCLS